MPVPARIATFDNDGTLIVEQPMYFQIQFAEDRIRAMLPANPAWNTTEPFATLISGDRAAQAALGDKGFTQVMAAAHQGTTTDAFAALVADWLATARHPRFDRPYTELVYQPMLELMAHLRANGFKTFVVTGSDVAFLRPWTEAAYGIPPEQVVGSSAVTTYRLDGDIPVIDRSGDIAFVDDGPGKPAGIDRFIGRRPVFAAGNSDGDLRDAAMDHDARGPRLRDDRAPHRRRARMGLRPRKPGRPPGEGARPGPRPRLAGGRHGGGLGEGLSL